MSQGSPFGGFSLAIGLAALVVLYRSYHSGILPSGWAGAYRRENGAFAFGCMLTIFLIIDVVIIIKSVQQVING